MPISVKTGTDFDAGGKYLQSPGWYHVCVTGASDMPTKQDGTLLPNAFLRLDLSVLAGTTPKCEEKTTEITLFSPRPEARDGGAFSQKIIDRTLLALGVIRPDQKDAEVVFEAQDLVGRQCVVQLRQQEGKKYLELAYADIYHVDDPEVANQPKHAGMLGVIPPELRMRKAATPAPKPAAPLPVSSLDL